MPTVLPAIRFGIGMNWRAVLHLPAFTAVSNSRIKRVRASNCAIAWSATSDVFTPGVLQAKIPSRVAASRSIESTPTPIRLSTLILGQASRTSESVSGSVPIKAPSMSRSNSI